MATEDWEETSSHGEGMSSGLKSAGFRSNLNIHRLDLQQSNCFQTHFPHLWNENNNDRFVVSVEIEGAIWTGRSMAFGRWNSKQTVGHNYASEKIRSLEGAGRFYWLTESNFEVITKHKQGFQAAGHEDMFFSVRKCCPATHSACHPWPRKGCSHFSSPPTLRTAWWYHINLIDYICTVGSQDWGLMCYSLKFAEKSLGRETSYYMMSVSKGMICNRATEKCS